MLIFITLIKFIFFFFLFFSFFYPIGFWIIQKVDTSISEAESISLSLCIGILIFIFLATLAGILYLRSLVLPVLAAVNLTALFKFRKYIFTDWKIFIKDKLLLGALLVGILIQGSINFPSGFKYQEGLYFWSSQGHDGLWHVALMEEIKKQFPPQNPIFAGEPLYNYHYLVDVLMGEFGRIFPIFSSLDLYFRFFPVIFSFLIGITVFAFVVRWQNNSRIGYLSLFFIYLVGSFGFIVTFIKNGNIFAGETIFWAAQQNTILGNPPHAMSHFLLAAFFLAFLMYVKKRSLGWLMISFLMGSVMAGVKVSGGLVMLVGIVAAAAVDLIINKGYRTFILAFGLGLTNFLTFKSMTSPQAASFLMFLPWWFIRTMVVVKLDWIDLENQRQHYLSKGTWHAMLRVVQLETTAFLIFVIGNLGMRFIGIWGMMSNFFKGKIIRDPVEVMLVFSMLTGLIIPLFFVQKGIIYNNIQFMQYFLLIFGFYAAVSTYKIFFHIKNHLFRYLVMVMIVCFSIPTVIGNLVEFYGPKTTPLAKITNGELAALTYLNQNSNPDAVILNMPFNKDLKGKFNTQPRPIYAWYSTGYISALAGRRSFLAGEEQVLITGYPLEERLLESKTFFSQKDFNWNKNFLQKNKIAFIYIAKNEIEKPLDPAANNLEVSFENSEVVIYKVKG